MANAVDQYGSDAPPQTPDAQDRNAQEQARQALAQQFQNKPPDLTAGARGFSAADAALGSNPFGKALMGTAENLSNAATDVAVKSPVGAVALIADAAGLNTGLMRGATDDQGHPNWSSGKVAYEHLMDAFGKARVATSSPYLATIATAPLVAGALGEMFGTPGGGGVKGALAIPKAIAALPKEAQGFYKTFAVMVESLKQVKVGSIEDKGDLEHLTTAVADMLIDLKYGAHDPEVATEAAKVYGTLPDAQKKIVSSKVDEIDLHIPEPFSEGGPPHPDAPSFFADQATAATAVNHQKQNGFVRKAFTAISDGDGLRADQVNVLRRAANGDFGTELKEYTTDQLEARGKQAILQGPVTDHIDPTVQRAMANNDFFAVADKKPGDYEMFRQPSNFDGYDASVPHWSGDGGVAFGMKYYTPVAEKLAPAERNTIQFWHSQGYDDLAEWIRAGQRRVTNPLFLGTPIETRFPEMVKALESALAKFPMPENVVMFRGVHGAWAQSFSEGVEKAMEIIRKDPATSAVLTKPIDPSAFSVSSSYKRAASFAGMGESMTHGHPGLIIEFHIPKGTPSAFVDAVIHNSPEEEWLLGFNTRVRIKDVVRPFINNEGQPGHIVLEVLPPKRGGK